MNAPNFQIYAPLMTPQVATLRYQGDICPEGVSALLMQIQTLFDYYRYDHIELNLESPGGSLAGLDYLLRNIGDYRAGGKELRVRTTFMCASAAALLLAFGAWGERRVDRRTMLLFHFARVGGNLAGLTAEAAHGYSKELERHDRDMIGNLVSHLFMQAGGTVALFAAMRIRLDLLDAHWIWVAQQVKGYAASKKSNYRPDWFKKLRVVSKADADAAKSVASFVKYLRESFQRDQVIDLREAYALALIDAIDGVVEPLRVLAPEPPKAPVQVDEALDDESSMSCWTTLAPSNA